MRADFRIIGAVGLLSCFLVVSACGGGATPKADAPDKAAKSSSKGQDEGDSAGGDKPKKAAAKKAEPVEDTSPKPTRTALDIITAPDVSFVLSFGNSEVGEKADESCSKKA